MRDVFCNPIYGIQAQNMILGKTDDLPIQRNLQTKNIVFDFFSYELQ